MTQKTVSPKGDLSSGILSKVERDEFIDRATLPGAQGTKGEPVLTKVERDEFFDRAMPVDKAMPLALSDVGTKLILRPDAKVLDDSGPTRLISDTEAKSLIETTAAILGGAAGALEFYTQAKNMPFSELTKAIEVTKADAESTRLSLKYNEGMRDDWIKKETKDGRTLEEVRKDYKERPMQNSLEWFEMMVEMQTTNLAKEETRLRVFEHVREQRQLDGENK